MRTQDGQENLKKKKRALRQYDVQIRVLEIIWRTTLEINSDQCFSHCNTLFSPCYTLFGSKVESIKIFSGNPYISEKCHSHPSLKFSLGMVGRWVSQSLMAQGTTEAFDNLKPALLICVRHVLWQWCHALCLTFFLPIRDEVGINLIRKQLFSGECFYIDILKYLRISRRAYERKYVQGKEV